MGERKNELNLFDCYQAYLRRFDIEHLFRFAKNKLLLNNYYSTKVEREKNWVELVFLSYVNLWDPQKFIPSSSTRVAKI